VNDDGSVEIRIEKCSISENASQHRKQASQRGGFDAVVELGSSANQSWHLKTFVTDMEKYFDNLKVVNLSGKDSSASEKSLRTPELDTADVEKQAVDLNASADSDSRDTLSLVIDSVEPSDEEDDRPSAVDTEGENNTGLKITDVCSIDAEAFTDLNEPMMMTCSSVASDVPQETESAGRTAGDVEISQHSYTDANDDVGGTDMNVTISDSEDDTEAHCDKHVEDSHIGTSTIHDGDDSTLSAEPYHIESTHNNSSVNEDCRNHSASTDGGMSPLSSDTEDTNLFGISFDSEAVTDALLILSSPERAADPLSELAVSPRAVINSQHSVEQQASTSSDKQIQPAAQSSYDEAVEQLPSILPDKDSEYTIEPADCPTAVETVSTETRLTVETGQLSALDECGSPVVAPQLCAERNEAATGTCISEVLNDSEGEKGQLVTEDLSNCSSDFVRQDLHVMSSTEQNNADHAIMVSSHNMELTADLCNDENVQSQQLVNDESTLPSHNDVNTADTVPTDYPSRRSVEDMSENSFSSSAREESQNTASTRSECQQINGTMRDGLDQSVDMVIGKKAASAVTVPETEKSTTPTRHVSYRNLFNTELLSPLPESPITDVGMCGSSLAVAGSQEMESVGSLVPVETSEAPTRCNYSNVLDTEPVSPIQLIINTDVGDVATADSSPAGLTDDRSDLVPVLENEISESVTKGDVINAEPVSPLPEPSLATGQELISPPVPLTEKSASPARHTYSNLTDNHPVSARPEPTRDANLHELEGNSSFSVNSASLLPPVTQELLSATKHSSSKLCKTKSTSSVCEFDKSLLDVRPISPTWLSTKLSESQSRYERARLGAHNSRRYATVEHHPSSSSDVKQLRVSHQAVGKVPSVAKIPKRITLADYRNRKSASQVHAADNICRQVEPSQYIGDTDSCDTASKVSESRSISSSAEVLSGFHSPHLFAGATEMDDDVSPSVTTGTDAAVTVDNLSQRCTDDSRLTCTSLTDNIPMSYDLQPTAFPPCTLGALTDLTSSSSCPAENSACRSTDVDAQTEEETITSNDADDSSKSVSVKDDSAHKHPSEKQIMETATRIEHSDVLTATSCADVEKFQVVNQDNLGPLSPLSSHADDVIATDYSNDGQNAKSSVEYSELLCSSGSEAELSAAEAVKTRVTASSSLTGTDAEILNDVILDFAVSSKKERKAKRKMRRATRKPWEFTLIPVDADNLSNYERPTASGSADVRTLPKHLRNHDHEFELKDCPVAVPLEPTNTHHCQTGSHSFDSTSDTVADSCLSVVSLKNAEAVRPSTTNQEQLLQCCNKTPLLTDSSELSSVVSEDDTSSSDMETTDSQHHCSNTHVTDNSETEDGDALKPGVSMEMQASSTAVNEQDGDISTSTCIQPAQPSGITLSPFSAVSVEMEIGSSNSDFDIADGQHIARSPRFSISSLSKVLNLSHLTITTSQCGLETSATSHSQSDQKLVTTVDDNLVDINNSTDPADRLKHDGQVLPSAVNSEKPLESCAESISYNKLTAENLLNSSEMASKTDDLAEVIAEEYTSQDSVVKKGEKKEESRPRKSHLKAATMWRDSMCDWLNMDISKNQDRVLLKYTLSSDYFVMRHQVTRLMTSLVKLAPRESDCVKDAVSSSLSTTENMLQEELVFVDIAAQLNSTEAKLLVEKKLRMNDLLNNVEAQLHDLSMELHYTSDAEAELTCFEKVDWSTGSGRHHNILLLTRHMLYREMSSLRCYHKSRLVYRLPEELCLDVERDRFVSVEGSVLFLQYSILPLANCRELFALKVEIEETQSNLAQLNNYCLGSIKLSDVACRLGWLHRERKKKLDEISVKSADDLQTLQAFLSQQLTWYRYVNSCLIHYGRPLNTVKTVIFCVCLCFLFISFLSKALLPVFSAGILKTFPHDVVRSPIKTSCAHILRCHEMYKGKNLKFELFIETVPSQYVLLFQNVKVTEI